MIGSAEILEVDSSDEAALEALKSIPIPPCPEVVFRLLEEARQEEPDFSRIARLIGDDVALAAAVLKMANSPFFGLRRKIQSVKQAAAVLGLRNLLKIIYGVVLRQSLGGTKAPAMRRFWERSNYNAVVCTYFAARLSGVSIDDAYTFGLFHDAGIAVLMQKYADYKQTLMTANAGPRPITAVEDEHYPTNHVIVGALLGRDWYLPDHVVWAIRYHHEYSIFEASHKSLTSEVCALVAIRLLSEHVVAHFLNHADDAEWERTREIALNHLGWMENDVDDLTRAMHENLQEIRRYRGD